MAYGMFSAQKISLTNQIFLLQQTLENIMDQKQKLLNYSAHIADGIVTSDEKATDPTNLQNYDDFEARYQAWIATPDSEGGAATSYGYLQAQIGDTSNGNDELVLANAQVLQTQFRSEFAKQYQKNLDAVENQLDIQQQKIQTKLSAAEKQLQAVEDAEAKAIDRATPKYDGVG